MSINPELSPFQKGPFVALAGPLHGQLISSDRKFAHGLKVAVPGRYCGPEYYHESNPNRIPNREVFIEEYRLIAVCQQIGCLEVRGYVWVWTKAQKYDEAISSGLLRGPLATMLMHMVIATSMSQEG